MKTAQEHQNSACFSLMAEEIRQTSQQLCEEAAVLLETAQDLVHNLQAARQQRQERLSEARKHRRIPT